MEGKISLESNLGPNLMLSLLARLNFGVEIAKMTQFGAPSGTKWALGNFLTAQSRSNSAQKGSKKDSQRGPWR